jgi:hypothetical protein
MIAVKLALCAALTSLELVACAQYPDGLATKRTERQSRRIVRQWLHSIEQLQSWKYDHVSFAMDETTEMLADSIVNPNGLSAEVASTGVFYSLQYFVTNDQGERSNVNVYFNSLKKPLFITNLCVNQQEIHMAWENRDAWVPVRCSR